VCTRRVKRLGHTHPDGADPLRRRDPAGDSLGRHGRADGEKGVGELAGPPLDLDVRRPARPGLELMEREAVKGMHDAADLEPVRG
jgi:hypothetical protein